MNVVAGMRRERLIAQRPDPSRVGHWFWLCECGNEKSIRVGHVLDGGTKSCGCKRRPHGQTGRSEHRAWLNLIQRCTNPAHRAYPHYGGRGITVCERWRKSVDAFIADVGPRPSAAHSIERIDNGKGYEPGNCRWATHAEQARNRRSSRMISYAGETLCATDWANRIGISVETLIARLKAGWTIERALTTTPQPKRRRIPGGAP